MITIWNWKESQIILRSKSFQNDVNNVLFSPNNPGQLTSCGKNITYEKKKKTNKTTMYYFRSGSHKILENVQNIHGIKVKR